MAAKNVLQAIYIIASTFYITVPAFYIIASAFYIIACAFYIIACALYIITCAFYIIAPAFYIIVSAFYINASALAYISLQFQPEPIVRWFCIEGLFQLFEHHNGGIQNAGFAPKSSRASWFIIYRIPFIKTIIVFYPFHHRKHLFIRFFNKSILN